MLHSDWFTGDENDLKDTNGFSVPEEECTFTGIFLGRRGLMVRSSGWHAMECFFLADDGRKIKLYAHRYHWYARNKKYGCYEKGREPVVYSAWNTDFPIDFADGVIIGSRWRCEIKVTGRGTVAWHRAIPISTAKTNKKNRNNQLYGPQEIPEEYRDNPPNNLPLREEYDNTTEDFAEFEKWARNFIKKLRNHD